MNHLAEEKEMNVYVLNYVIAEGECGIPYGIYETLALAEFARDHDDNGQEGWTWHIQEWHVDTCAERIEHLQRP